MADDERRHGVPPLKVRRSEIMQNLASEIEAASSDIHRMGSKEGQPTEAEGVIDRCRQLLKVTVKDYNGRGPRELFIWQSLFQIQQDLLLVLPSEELLAEWEVVQMRITKTQEKGTKFPWDDSQRKEIEDQLRSSAGDDASNRGVRSRIREIRKYLDDRDVLRLWRSMQIRRYRWLFAMLAVLFGALLAMAICVSSCWFGHCIADNQGYGLFGMVMAGSLGASLSALANVGRLDQEGVPVLSGLQLVRPVIGAASGLFLYLVWQTQIIEVTGAAPYLFAIAFGFSERALFGVLQSMAEKTERDIGRAWRQ